MRRTLVVLLLAAWAGCHTAGSDWIAQPLPGDDDPVASRPGGEEPTTTTAPALLHPSRRSQARAESPRTGTGRYEGRVLGTFRNTYYDFPSEGDYQGRPVALKSAQCKTIKLVPSSFYDAVCVQGSGTLSTGTTVSFARRDCPCARVCPKTEQKICFDQLDPRRFPWGRGATGKAITPLLTVAVDESVLPMGTALFIPEFAGLPTGPGGSAARHDGCFVAQDKGARVVGKHIDVFTGSESMTAIWNGLVPSNRGVTVVVDSPRCARAEVGHRVAPAGNSAGGQSR